MVHRSKIDLKDVPADWRPVEEIRRQLDLSMEDLSDLLDISYQTYHDRTSGKVEGRYSDAFCALAEKIRRLYYRGLSINAKKSFALKYVKDNLETPEGEVHESDKSDGDVRPIPGSVPGTGNKGSLSEQTEDGDGSDRGEAG